MHQSNELSTLSQQLYSLLKILHNYVHGDLKTQYLLQQSVVLFVPIVNYDGYLAISHDFNKTGV